MKHILLCLTCVAFCVSMNSQAISAASGGKKKHVKELELKLKQLEDEKSIIEINLSELDRKYKELQRFINSSSCSVSVKNDQPVAQVSTPGCICENTLTTECSELKEQNKSLRDTIQAQNEYLLNADNSGQISQKLIDENNNNKNKAYYLEQASKSSAKEIKKLMILNENLQKELAKYKGE